MDIEDAPIDWEQRFADLASWEANHIPSDDYLEEAYGSTRVPLDFDED